jgi:hypothetical protein
VGLTVLCFVVSEKIFWNILRGGKVEESIGFYIHFAFFPFCSVLGVFWISYQLAVVVIDRFILAGIDPFCRVFVSGIGITRNQIIQFITHYSPSLTMYNKPPCNYQFNTIFLLIFS